MLPTLQKLRTLNKLLALARPAGRPISAPDGVRPPRTHGFMHGYLLGVR